MANYKPAANKRMTPEDEEFILSCYLDKEMSGPQILKAFDGKFKTVKSIYDALARYNIQIRTPSDYVKMNHRYFASIDNPHKAYVLGLMITDGWVFSPRGQVGISQCKEREYIIEYIKKQWQTDNKIVTKKPKILEIIEGHQYHSQEGKQLLVNSKPMVSDLTQYGVVSRKTSKEWLPCLSKYQSHLIRGLIDGDGSIYLHSITKHPCIRMIGSAMLVGQLMWCFARTLGTTMNGINKKGNCALHYADWSKQEEVREILRYVYQDKEEVMYVRSKWDVAKDYIL